MADFAAVLLLLLILRPAFVLESRELLKDVAVLAIDESPSTEVADRDAEIAAELERLSSALAIMKTLEIKCGSGMVQLLKRATVQSFSLVCRASAACRAVNLPALLC